MGDGELRDSILLKLLKERNLIPPDKIKAALDYRDKLGSGASLADAVVNLGLLTEEQISQLTAESKSLETVDITDRQIDFEAIEKIPQAFLEKHAIVPLADKKGKILLAMAEPVGFQTVDEIQFMTNCLIETVVAPRKQIVKAIEEAYSLSPRERKARAREVETARPAALSHERPIPKSPHLADVLAEILIERGLVTREEIVTRLKTREL